MVSTFAQFQNLIVCGVILQGRALVRAQSDHWVPNQRKPLGTKVFPTSITSSEVMLVCAFHLTTDLKRL